MMFSSVMLSLLRLEFEIKGMLMLWLWMYCNVECSLYECETVNQYVANYTTISFGRLQLFAIMLSDIFLHMQYWERAHHKLLNQVVVALTHNNWLWSPQRSIWNSLWENDFFCAFIQSISPICHRSWWKIDKVIGLSIVLFFLSCHFIPKII